jgi:hypothetical protein
LARNVPPQVAAAASLRLGTPLPAQRRRNLVFFRCGARALHRRFYPLPADRSWDCAVSCYEPPEPSDSHADYVLTGGVSKWDAFAQARFEHPELGFGVYERFFLVDDDIEFREVGDIDRMFGIANEHGLAICQPSLSLQSHASWLITRNNPSWFLRFTNYVESMMPMLTGEAVQLLEEDLRFAVSGYGVDIAFHHVLGPQRRLAIVDAVVVSHTKPIDSRDGPFYRYLRSIGVDANEELAWFLSRHGMSNFGAITTGGIPIVQWAYPPS